MEAAPLPDDATLVDTVLEVQFIRSGLASVADGVLQINEAIGENYRELEARLHRLERMAGWREE